MYSMGLFETYLYWMSVIVSIVTLSHLEHYRRYSYAYPKQDSSDSSGVDCRGIFKLQPPMPPKTMIKEQTAVGMLSWYDHTVQGYLYKRELYTNYQYYGTALDTNSYPMKRWQSFLPDTSELEEWIRTKKCQVGRNLCGESDFWGSWSQECLKSPRDLLTTNPQWVNDEVRHECSGGEWIKFPYHTCLISWSCFIREIDLPVRVLEDGKIYSSFSNGTMFELTKHIYTMEKGAQLYIPTLPLKHQSEVILDCLGSENSGGLKCILRSGPKELIGGVYSGNSTYVANRHSNILVNLTSLNMTASERVIISDKSASLSDLYEVDSLVREVSLRSDLNDFELTKGLTELTGVVTRLIENLSQKDPLLLSKVLQGEELYRTVYTSGGLFTKCLIARPYKPVSEFCVPQGLTMQSGIPVPWDGKSVCLKPNAEVTPIVLLHEIHEIEGLEKGVSIEGASFQWSIYEFIELERLNMEESMNRVKKYSSALMSDVLENPLNTWCGSILSLTSVSFVSALLCSLLFLLLLKVIW
uniref:Glycoprotein n=1 Tax=Varroa orthomyxovirus-1 TaxID=2510845 RepID=A0A5Q0TT41_9ORTO|nr:glycoprotein [Varroa orthomyxovirus-1]